MIKKGCFQPFSGLTEEAVKKHLPGNLYQTRNNQCSIKPIIYASYATIYNAYGIISLNPHTKETIEATPLIFAAA